MNKLSLSLKKYKNSDNLDEIVSALVQEQKEIEESLYIIKVFNAAQTLEKCIIDKGFEKNTVCYVEFSFYLDEEDNKNNHINMFLLDLNKEQIYHISHYQLLQKVYEKLEELRNTNFNVMKKELYFMNKNIVFDVKCGLGDKFMQTLLSENLYKKFMYSKMDNDIQNSKMSTRQKI